MGHLPLLVMRFKFWLAYRTGIANSLSTLCLAVS